MAAAAILKLQKITYLVHFYDPILMKFETHVDNSTYNIMEGSPKAFTEIQDGRRRHLEFHKICRHFIAN